jgi:NAD(P)-dependent dehydrogenase (short-subunit alcohol dehydrogenase family)
LPSLTGQRVLLTGAGGAFGRAARERLEGRGAVVAGLDRAAGDGVELECDVTEPEAAAAAVADAAARLGGLDVLVNNAAIGTASTLADGFGETERAVLEVNLVGAWNVTAAALPHLVAARGQVVNVASLLSVVNAPYTDAYAASKRGLCALGDTLRFEHGDRVAVTTVYPGYVATPIHGPAEERSGKTLAGVAPEETVDHAARAIVRAIERRPRELATTRGGAVVLRAARVAPRLSTPSSATARGAPGCCRAPTSSRRCRPRPARARDPTRSVRLERGQQTRGARGTGGLRGRPRRSVARRRPFEPVG